MVSSLACNAQLHPVRILIGKVGLDGHDRGAKYVAHILLDAVFEVIYTVIPRAPAEIAEAAVQEDVAVMGLSVLSGAHIALFRRVIDQLRRRGAAQGLLIGGGTIPPADVKTLKAMGVAEVFTPGTPARTIVDRLGQLLENRQVA
jgi:methylmalonyl-CoA mutase C-terminal domain/subunit